MTPAIFARTYSINSLNELFLKADNDGIKGLHYNMVCSGLDALPSEIPDEVLKEIVHELIEPGIQLIGLSATYNMIHPDPEVVRSGRSSLTALAKAARELEIPMLSLCTGTRNTENKWKGHPDNHSAESWKELTSEMEKALSIASPLNLYLGVEPEPGNVMCSAKLALKLIREMQSPYLKVILDPANLFEEAADQNSIRYLIHEAMDLLHEHIILAHAKDRTLSGQVMPAGKGDVDFPLFIDLLHQAGYEGPLVMHSLGEEDVPGSKRYLEEIIKDISQ